MRQHFTEQLGTAFAAVTNPTPVLTNPGDEYAYRISGTTSIWFQNTPASRNHYNAYIRTAAGLRQLNAAGTTGYGGGVDGTTVLSPATWVKMLSGDWLCVWPPKMPPPKGARTVIGAVNSPALR